MPRDGRNPQTGETLKVTILLPVAGTFGLSANVTDTITIDKKQATEMIKSGHAEQVQSKKFKGKRK